MADGFVKLHRKIQDNWLWQDKPFSKGQAWIDLLLLANHAEGRFPLGNEIVTVVAGQIITSEKKLMERWGWSKSKLRYFLFSLESDSMLVKISDNKKTILTLCNYSDYNKTETAKEPQTDCKKTANRPQKDTIKKKENKENNKKDIYNPLTPLEKAVEDFKNFRKGIKKPMTDRAVELLHGSLERLAPGDDALKIKILEQSILRGWAGVFELKQDKGGANYGTNSEPNGRIKPTLGNIL